jgi:tRNA G18 (ribose-2'-O)-methylase SpoU
MSDKRGAKLSMTELERKSLTEFKSTNKLPVILVLDDIRSLHNIGSVFRTSDAFAIEKVILCGITAQPPHREIQKTALGATESVDWEYAPVCFDAVQELKELGYKAYGVEQVVGSVCLSDFHPPREQKSVLIFGNEVRGVSQAVLDLCDDYIEIPQYGTKHSLNISVSVGVVLWELARTYRI